VESTFKYAVTTNTQPTYESVDRFMKTRNSVGSKERVETNGQTDGWTGATDCF